MSTCIEKLPCPDCGSSDSIQTYINVDEALGIEWITSFCHSECWSNKGDPYNGAIPTVHIKSPEEIREEIEDVRECKIFAPKRSYRGIPKEFYRSWGVRTLLSTYDGKRPYAIGFPYSDYGDLRGWKCRPFHKKDYYGLGRTANADLFGWARAQKLPGNVLWITEGEFDAIALDYAMTLVGSRSMYPVTSLGHGGGSLSKNFEYMSDRIARYDYIVLVVDDDEVGLKAEQTALEMWPNLVHIVRKPKGCKDANDAVENGKAVEMGRLALNFWK